MEGLDLKAQDPASPKAGIAPTVAASEAPVLVAVDFSPESEAALIWACDYAEKVGFPLEILHVVHDPADSPGTYRDEGKDSLRPMADVAQDKLVRFVDRIGADNPDLPGIAKARSLCVQGLPAATILEVAQAHGARLLVLGGRRRNGLARLLHGSTAHQVASHARLPVTVVKADGR